MIGELKTIWSKCFGDSDAYIDFYFRRRYRPEQTLVHRENGQAAGMLTILPATVVTAGAALPAGYIYAVATLPEYRHRGIAAQLVAQACRQIQTEGGALAIVAPASESLFRYYAQLGFSTAFFRQTHSFPVKESTDTACGNRTVVAPLDDIEQLYALREQYFARCASFVRWNREALRYAVDECRLSGGEVLQVSDGERSGYCFASPHAEKNTVCVKECAFPATLQPAVSDCLAARYPYHTKQVFYLPETAEWKTPESIREPIAMVKQLTRSAQNIPAVPAYIGLLKD